MIFDKLINLKQKKHLIPLFFTISNVLITIVFNILLSSGIYDINISGKLRYLQERLKMCYFASQMNVSDFMFDICVTDTKHEIRSITNKLYSKYKSGILLGNKDTVIRLKDNVDVYIDTLTTNTIYNLTDVSSFMNNSHSIVDSILQISSDILDDANILTNDLVNIAKKMVYILAGLMGFVIVCQIFYNINTILFKQEEKKKYELMVENKAINQMCHELRSSLLPIELYVRELKDYTMYDDNILIVINNMQKCINEIDYILKRRLDFVKILDNSYEIVLSEIDIVEFIRSYIPIFNMYAETNNKTCNINVIYNIELEDYYCKLDVYLLHHILTNLLRNAVKFGNEDKENNINIKVDIQHKYKLHLSIEDTGIGFDSKKQKQDSYGLGLPFVRTILELLKNGKFRSHNKMNDNGSIVKIYFELNEKIYSKNLEKSFKICHGCDSYDDSYGDSYDNSYCDSYYNSYENTYEIDIDEYIIDNNECANNVIQNNVEDMNINVYIIDDSYVVLKCVERVIKKICKNKWNIKLFLNCEEFIDYHKNRMYNITDVFIVDNNMESSGGILKGVEFVKNLREINRLPNIMIIMSGNDVECDNKYNIIIWGKPLPKNEVIHRTIIGNLRELLENSNKLENIL